MKQLLSVTTATVVALLTVFMPLRGAVAQTTNRQFAGSSWTLVSGTVDRGGRKVRLIVPRLQGFLMFEANNHFLMVITHFGHSKFGSKNGWEQTPGGGHSNWQRSVACFGRYSINESDHTISAHIDASTFPKWVGTEQKRQYTAVGDKLKWTNASLSGAGRTADLVWKRAK
jgi:hypothetical protein